MKFKFKRSYLYVISALAFAATLFFLLRSGKIQLGPLLEAIQRFPVSSLCCALLAFSGQFLCQNARLWILVPRGSGLGWFGIGRAFFYGQVVNSFVPARAGDAVKAIAIHRESNAGAFPIANAAGLLVADKLIDILSFLTVCVWAGGSWVSQWEKIPSPTPLGVTITLVIIAALAFGLPRLFPRAVQFVKKVSQQFFQGLSALKRPKAVILSFLFSVTCWFFEALAIHFLTAGQGHSLGLTQALWVILILNLGIAVPVSVANLGAHEAAMALGLSQFQIPAVESLAIGTVHHGLQMIGLFLWAFLFWAQGKLFPRKSSSQD